MDLYETTEHNMYLPHIPQYRAPFSVTQALFQRNTAHGSVRSHGPHFVLTTHPAVQSTVFGHPGSVPVVAAHGPVEVSASRQLVLAWGEDVRQ